MNRCRTASGIRKPPEGITDNRDERCVRAGDEARRMTKRNGDKHRGWKHLEGKSCCGGIFASRYVQYRKLTPCRRTSSSSAFYLRWKKRTKTGEGGGVDKLQVRQCEQPVVSVRVTTRSMITFAAP